MKTKAEELNKYPVISIESIANKVYLIRGVKVMLDSDLAYFYGVSTIRLNEQVKRNINRFPDDFVFRISKDEYDSLISQIAISKNGSGGRRHLPRVFTEHGAVMLSSILRSDKAVEMSKFIVRAFIKIREILSSNKDLAYKVQELEREQKVQNKHINALYAILGKLMDEPVKDKKPIGFQH